MSWKQLADSHPMARIDHACRVCGEPIRAGERHTQKTGLWNGKLTSFRMHDECHETVMKLSGIKSVTH